MGTVRTACYFRISPKPDENKEVLAIARQRDLTSAMCATRGWTPTCEYVDESVSATSKKPRPAYEQMLRDIADGQYDAVAAWDLDRLHRKLPELITFIDLANRMNVQLATTQGIVDISTPDGRLMARMMAVVAQYEIEHKVKRQKDAALQRAEGGKHWGDRRPFGYQFNGDGSLRIDEGEAMVVKELYHGILDGVPQRRLAQLLNAQGLVTTLGNPWRQSSLRAVLMNPRYIGLRTYVGKEIGPGKWDAIVDEETYRAAVFLLNSNPRALGHRGDKYLLSGLPKCGAERDGEPCGATLYVARTNRPGALRLYKCQKCGRIGRNADRLEELATEALLAWLETPKAARAVMYREGPGDDNVHSQIETYNVRLETLAAEREDGGLTEREFQAARRRVLDKIAVLEDTARKSLTHAAVAPLMKHPRGPRAAWAEPSFTLEKKRAAIGACLNITVRPTAKGPRFNPRDIDITWKVAA